MLNLTEPQKSNLKIAVKVVFMGLALISVVQAYSKFKSREFRKYLMETMGTSPVIDWCPASTYRVINLPTGHEIMNDEGIIEACLLTNEPVSKDELDRAVFVPWMAAENPTGRRIVLEADLALKIYRLEGLPFKSPSLDK